MRTLAALTTTTLSPQSTCGVNCGLCLPAEWLAMTTARRPKRTPSASISTQSFFTSAGFSERVVFSIGDRSLRVGGGIWGKSMVRSRVWPCGNNLPQPPNHRHPRAGEDDDGAAGDHNGRQ